jgi:RimJ/RimL family protein N-acetyltransferase
VVLDEIFLKGTIDNRKPHSRAMITAFLGWLFSRGAVFWICFEEKNLVGYLWSLRGSGEDLRYHFFPLGTRDVVFLAHEIFPPYRGRELNRKMTHLVLGEMKSSGVERVYVDVELSNKPSLKSFSKTLFVPFGQARMKNFRKRQIVIWKYPKQAVATGTIQES